MTGWPGDHDLSGRRVVVTGAGRGLGAEIARAFAGAGCHVGLVARTASDLERVAASLPGEHLLCVADVTQEDANDLIVERMVDRFGGIDVWVCNAGISPVAAPVTEMSAAQWREIIDVNLTGTFLGARAAAGILGPGGRIIVTGSVVGLRPRHTLSAYAASKAAVHALVQAMALELGPREITVNAIAPGWFAAGVGTHWERNERRHRAIADHTALERWGAPEELTGAYLFLASQASAYVTGTVLPVDGGYALR